MGKGLEYGLPKTKLNNNSKHQAKPEMQRRVWVQRPNGNPTTIMMGKDNIVDDLKLAISSRFPNSLARFYDPSDLQIKLNLKSSDKFHQAKFSKRRSSILRLTLEFNDETHKSASNSPNSVRPIIFEPDQNVWQILDEYFGDSMAMSDALIVEVGNEALPGPMLEKYTYNSSNEIDPQSIREEGSQSPQQKWGSQLVLPAISHLHNPKPQYPYHTKSKLLIKNSSISPHVSARLSPLSSSHTGLHKRSLSNPSQSPESYNHRAKSNPQAVLLLPKNFSLGEQHSLKRLSLDESSLEKAAYGLKSNVTNIGTSPGETFPANVHTRPPDIKQGSFSKSDSNIEVMPLLTLESVDSQDTPKRNEIETLSSEDNSMATRDRLKLKEKTINTSTFEKVLPLISVLVVEDNTINQAILGAFLRKHKIHYQIAKNGQEAVDKWRKGGFHLVLMDIQLPVKSGIDATKEIRSLEKINRIGVFAQHELTNNSGWGQSEIKEEQKLDLNIFRSPVIIVALTASSNSSVDKKNALTAGCNDFLTKPVNLVWLQNKITEWGCMQALIDFDGWKFKDKA